MLHFLDWFFIIIHTLIIFFNLFGWIWKKTRKANLILLLLTGLSWTVLGIWYGFGYCPFTDWHWRVLYKLGHHHLPNSYIKYLIDRLLGTKIDPCITDFVVTVVFSTAFIASILTNTIDFIRQKRKPTTPLP